MDRPDFDVVIVGAGPSGCCAAIDLRQHGYRVLLLDQASFPRVKPCAGGLIDAAVQALPHSVAPLIEHHAQNVHVGARLGDTIIAQPTPLNISMVQRPDFDRFNFDQAIAAGAIFQQITGLDDITEQADYVRIETGGQIIHARWLIAADGAKSGVRRLIRPQDGFRLGFALEAIIDLDDLGETPATEIIFGQLDHGYGWVFTKARHVNYRPVYRKSSRWRGRIKPKRPANLRPIPAGQ